MKTVFTDAYKKPRHAWACSLDLKAIIRRRWMRESRRARLPDVQYVAVYLRNFRSPSERHCNSHFLGQHSKQLSDSSLTARGQGIDKGSTDQDCFGP